ncbi:MAG: efflux RND transporter permease subunit [Gemmatimonadaceae bacterium]
MSTPASTERRPLFDRLVQHRRVVYLFVALLSTAGLWAAVHLPAAIYPELVFSRITVVANGSALGAREVLFGITRPLEEAISVVPGVTRVQSRAIRGGSEINITFAEGTDMQSALEQTRARVNRIVGELPAGLDIEVERMTPSLFPILSYNLEGGDPATLHDIAQYDVRPQFSRVPGVARVDVQASDVRELQVVADPARLAAQGLTYESLADAIRQSTTVAAVGRMPATYRQFLIVTTTEARAAADVANVMIGHGLRVRDVATVVLGTEDHVRVIAGNGHPAALLNITRQIGSNTVAMADSIEALAAAIRRTLPPGVRLTPMYDQALLVREAVASVRDAMLLGAVLSVLVLLFFLRHARITAISASSIPLTMVITTFVMARMGQTLNLMTLGAMAIAIGLVIDDAVVVTENIVRHLHLGADRTQAVRAALGELVWPVTTSTITTVVVFLPLGLLTGVEGQFFQALSITLTIAVLVSLGLSVTVIPLLSAQYLTPADADLAATATGTLGRLGAQLDVLALRYAKALGVVMRRPREVLVVALVLVASGVVTYRFIGTGFLPEMDEGAFVLDYWTPGGTALPETDRMVRTAERILAETPEVEGTSRRTGAELGLFATQQNRGDVVVRLKPRSQRARSSEEVIADVRRRIGTAEPRMRIEFVQILADVIGDLSGNARPIEVKLFGADLAALEKYGRTLGDTLGTVNGIEDLYNGVSEPSAELAMTYRRGELDRLGVTPAQVSGAVSGALLGVEAGSLRLDDRAVGIRVRAPDSARFNPHRLDALPVVTVPGARAVPLGALASFAPTETRAELLRENQQQMLLMTADISGRSLGDVVHDMTPVLAAHPAPSGVRVELAGQFRSQQQAFAALLVVLGLAAVSVVAVMLVQFESFVEPLVVLLAAPLSFVGALVLLLITGTPLNVSSFMGLILLVGLIVKNGIILLDFTRHRMREGGLALEPAIREAAAVRLRPILMTTLCTLFGLLPLALGLGAGSELQKPLALAVIGGLALSTPITLFIVPTLLVAVRGRDYRLSPDR